MGRHRRRDIVVELDLDLVVGGRLRGNLVLLGDIGDIVQHDRPGVLFLLVAPAPRDLDRVFLVLLARRNLDDFAVAGVVERVLAGEGRRGNLERERPVHPRRDVAVAGLEVVLLLHREQLVAQLGGAAEPLVGIACERAEHDRVELRRARLVERRRRHDVAALDLEQGLVLVLAREQRPRRQQLVRDHADGEQVGARVELLARDRLGRHVRELSLHAAGLRAKLRRLRLRDTEVDDLDVARARDEHVRRRDVAVDELERLPVLVALVVRVIERIAELEQNADGDVDRRRSRDLARVTEDATDIASVDVLHRDEVLGADTAELEDLDDVDVVEQRGELGFAYERLDEARVLREVRKQSLERHHPLETFDAALERAMHRGHSAHAETLVDQVRSERLFGLFGLGDHFRGDYTDFAASSGVFTSSVSA